MTNAIHTSTTPIQELDLATFVRSDHVRPFPHDLPAVQWEHKGTTFTACLAPNEGGYVVGPLRPLYPAFDHQTSLTLPGDQPIAFVYESLRRRLLEDHSSNFRDYEIRKAAMQW